MGERQPYLSLERFLVLREKLQGFRIEHYAPLSKNLKVLPYTSRYSKSLTLRVHLAGLYDSSHLQEIVFQSFDLMRLRLR